MVAVSVHAIRADGDEIGTTPTAVPSAPQLREVSGLSPESRIEPGTEQTDAGSRGRVRPPSRLREPRCPSGRATSPFSDRALRCLDFESVGSPSCRHLFGGLEGSERSLQSVSGAPPDRRCAIGSKAGPDGAHAISRGVTAG